MIKKQMYEAPSTEVLELRLESFIAYSGNGEGVGDELDNEFNN